MHLDASATRSEISFLNGVLVFWVKETQSRLRACGPRDLLVRRPYASFGVGWIPNLTSVWWYERSRLGQGVCRCVGGSNVDHRDSTSKREYRRMRGMCCLPFAPLFSRLGRSHYPPLAQRTVGRLFVVMRLPGGSRSALRPGKASRRRCWMPRRWLCRPGPRPFPGRPSMPPSSTRIAWHRVQEPNLTWGGWKSSPVCA